MSRPSSSVFSPEKRKVLCQTFVRGADNQPRLEGQAVAMLRTHPESLSVAMLQAAIENGGQGAAIIERALEWDDTPALDRNVSLAIASAIEEHLPWPTTTLRRAAMIVGLLVTADGNDVIPSDAPFHKRVNLALRCFDAGETLMALALAESAWTELQEGEGRTIDRPIATALAINLMIFLQEANRLDEARNVADVARQLIDGFPDTVAKEDVAAHLCRFRSSVALLYSALGDGARAIAEATQAIEVGYQLLAKGHTHFRIELTRSHANMAVLLAAAGKPRDALRQSLDSVRQARLAELADPDAGILLLGLAFESLSGAAFNAGRSALARSAIDQAIRFYSRLRERPRGVEARRVASAYVNAASVNEGVVAPELRHQWVQTGMALLQELDMTNPSAADVELSVAYSVAGLIYAALERRPEAIKALKEAEIRTRQDQSLSGKLRRMAIRANLAAVHNDDGNLQAAFLIKEELELDLAVLTPQERAALPGVEQQIVAILSEIGSDHLDRD
ncbi:hypothetical protein ACCS42_09140 [Rhizobium ruizarguesonis]